MFFFTEPNGDGNCEDFRSRDHLFDLMRYAQEFVIRYLPVGQMRHRDELTPLPDDYVLAQDGEVYAVYLPNGGTTELDLTGATGDFEAKWYDPRHGGALQDGSVKRLTGGASRALGDPPQDSSADWAVLVRRVGRS